MTSPLHTDSQTDITLAINAAEGRLQVAAGIVSQPNDAHIEMLFTFEIYAPKQGTELLAPAIREAMRRMHLPMKRIARIAVVNGPGGFTGVRLALTTTLGMTRALGVPSAGISYTAALATSAAACPYSLPLIWVLLHARRNQIMTQPFILSPDSPPTPLEAVRTLSVTEACPHIATITRTHGGKAGLLGSGLRKNFKLLQTQLEPEGLDFTLFTQLFDHPKPETLLALSMHATWSHTPVEADYARKCDAEDNLPHIAAARGLDPVQALETLHQLTSL